MKTAPDISPNPSAPASLPPADLRRILEEKDRSLVEKDHLLADQEVRLSHQEAELAKQQALLKEREALISEQQKLLCLLEEQLRLARLRKFRARSEKLPFQGELFDEAELEVSLEDVEQALAEAEAEPKKPRKRRTKADGFDENLPRIQVRLTLDEDEKAGARKTFFSKVKEELDIVPAQARVIEYWQEKAVFDTEDGSQQVKAAPRPAHPLGKCLASVQLLAWILVAKYADALPLYRLEGILKRHGGRISRTTMANWIIRLDDVFKPLINLLREQQLNADYLQADETRLQVLKETGKSAQSDKWMWVIRGGPPDRPAVLFEYDPSRSEAVPLRLLDGFRGTLQTDGYAGYNRVCRENGLTRIGCWDHARRKFVEASQAAPAKKKGKRVFGLVIDFGTSQSPKSTRPLTTHWCPSRPGHQALRNNFASSLLLRTWLPMTGRRVRRPTLFSLWRKARRENSAASRLLGSTSLRFALHGWQRTKVSKADVAIGKIRKLYAIEKRIEALPPEEKTRQRQQLALPVLNDLKAWLEKNRTRVPKDSLTYKAMQYTLNQWELLTGYLADGRLHISNALAENAIRPFAVGRRNWLFADTPRGAKASATVYSLIETAKANGLEPFAYIHPVLQHIGGASTVEEIEALLPWNVTLSKLQEG